MSEPTPKAERAVGAFNEGYQAPTTWGGIGFPRCADCRHVRNTDYGWACVNPAFMIQLKSIDYARGRALRYCWLGEARGEGKPCGHEGRGFERGNRFLQFFRTF